MIIEIQGVACSFLYPSYHRIQRRFVGFSTSLYRNMYRRSGAGAGPQRRSTVLAGQLDHLSADDDSSHATGRQSLASACERKDWRRFGSPSVAFQTHRKNHRTHDVDCSLLSTVAANRPKGANACSNVRAGLIYVPRSAPLEHPLTFSPIAPF